MQDSLAQPADHTADHSLQGATATLGIYVDSGSVYESPYTAGAAAQLEKTKSFPCFCARLETAAPLVDTPLWPSRAAGYSTGQRCQIETSLECSEGAVRTYSSQAAHCRGHRGVCPSQRGAVLPRRVTRSCGLPLAACQRRRNRNRNLGCRRRRRRPAAGASHLLEYMAFKTTKHRTHMRLVREVEVIGGNVLASASREQMAYNIDTSKITVPEALEVLADAVLNPKFQSWEVAEQVRGGRGLGAVSLAVRWCNQSGWRPVRTVALAVLRDAVWGWYGVEGVCAGVVR
jgi:hypothetical protein